MQRIVVSTYMTVLKPYGYLSSHMWEPQLRQDWLLMMITTQETYWLILLPRALSLFLPFLPSLPFLLQSNQWWQSSRYRVRWGISQTTQTWGESRWDSRHRNGNWSSKHLQRAELHENGMKFNQKSCISFMVIDSFGWSHAQLTLCSCSPVSERWKLPPQHT